MRRSWIAIAGISCAVSALDACGPIGDTPDHEGNVFAQGGSDTGGAMSRGGSGGTKNPSTAAGSAGRGQSGEASSGGLPATSGEPEPAANTTPEELLRLAVTFYGAQRSGVPGNWLLESKACHTQDGGAIGKDLAGGWHDAGDHIKFTLTIAYASYVLLKAYTAFPKAFDDLRGPTLDRKPNGIPDILDEVKYAIDYLSKAHLDDKSIVLRVGGDQDHSRWVTCVFQSSLSASDGGAPRPVIVGAKADVAGLMAAAFALASRAYATFDKAYATRCLEHAKAVYTLGKSSGMSTYADAFYTNSSAQDDMLCGAAELYVATNDSGYLQDAQQFDDAVKNYNWAPSWAQTADYGRHSLVKAKAAGNFAASFKSVVETFSGRVKPSGNLQGLAWFDGWGSLRYALGAAFGAALYFDVTGEARYKDFALSQLDYVTGKNAFGRSFIVGFGRNAPVHPHHRNAFGYDDNKMDERPQRRKLLGAMVGGPNEGGYDDNMSNFIRNEVGLDYNAGLVGTAAFAVSLERK